MAMASSGGGNQGLAPVRIECVPDSTLKSAIDALIAAKSEVRGTHCKMAAGVNRQITTVADDDAIQGVICDYRKTASSYRVVVDFYGYLDQGTVWNPALRIGTFKYTSTVALGNSIRYNSATAVEASASGHGRIIDINTTDTTVDVII